MRTMKYLAIITALVFFGTALLSASVGATSPRYIGLKYDITTHTLKVNVIHFSPAVRIHYIYRVEIDKDGQVYQVYLYQSQPRIFLIPYVYTNVTANPGETLTVSAYCVLWGFNQNSLVVQ